MNNITPTDAQKIIQGGDTAVIDVRTPEEFNEGHISGAININIYDEDFSEQVGALPKEKDYLVVCRGGARSSQACSIMSDLGFKSLNNLEGGMVAWIGAGLPTEE